MQAYFCDEQANNPTPVNPIMNVAQVDAPGIALRTSMSFT